jgi:hypothetical protein
MRTVGSACCGAEEDNAVRYFPKAGHALDPRTSYGDLVYTITPQATLEEVASILGNFFVPQRRRS